MLHIFLFLTSLLLRKVKSSDISSTKNAHDHEILLYTNNLLREINNSHTQISKHLINVKKKTSKMQKQMSRCRLIHESLSESNLQFESQHQIIENQSEKILEKFKSWTKCTSKKEHEISEVELLNDTALKFKEDINSISDKLNKINSEVAAKAYFENIANKAKEIVMQVKAEHQNMKISIKEANQESKTYIELHKNLRAEKLNLLRQTMFLHSQLTSAKDSEIAYIQKTRILQEKLQSFAIKKCTDGIPAEKFQKLSHLSKNLEQEIQNSQNQLLMTRLEKERMEDVHRKTENERKYFHRLLIRSQATLTQQLKQISFLNIEKDAILKKIKETTKVSLSLKSRVEKIFKHMKLNYSSISDELAMALKAFAKLKEENAFLRSNVGALKAILSKINLKNAKKHQSIFATLQTEQVQLASFVSLFKKQYIQLKFQYESAKVKLMRQESFLKSNQTSKHKVLNFENEILKSHIHELENKLDKSDNLNIELGTQKIENSRLKAILNVNVQSEDVLKLSYNFVLARLQQSESKVYKLENTLKNMRNERQNLWSMITNTTVSLLNIKQQNDLLVFKTRTLENRIAHMSSTSSMSRSQIDEKFAGLAVERINMLDKFKNFQKAFAEIKNEQNMEKLKYLRLQSILQVSTNEKNTLKILNDILRIRVHDLEVAALAQSNVSQNTKQRLTQVLNHLKTEREQMIALHVQIKNQFALMRNQVDSDYIRTMKTETIVEINMKSSRNDMLLLQNLFIESQLKQSENKLAICSDKVSTMGRERSFILALHKNLRENISSLNGQIEHLKLNSSRLQSILKSSVNVAKGNYLENSILNAALAECRTSLKQSNVRVASLSVQKNFADTALSKVSRSLLISKLQQSIDNTKMKRLQSIHQTSVDAANSLNIENDLLKLRLQESESMLSAQKSMSLITSQRLAQNIVTLKNEKVKLLNVFSEMKEQLGQAKSEVHLEKVRSDRLNVLLLKLQENSNNAKDVLFKIVTAQLLKKEEELSRTNLKMRKIDQERNATLNLFKSFKAIFLALKMEFDRQTIVIKRLETVKESSKSSEKALMIENAILRKHNDDLQATTAVNSNFVKARLASLQKEKKEMVMINVHLKNNIKALDAELSIEKIKTSRLNSIVKSFVDTERQSATQMEILNEKVNILSDVLKKRDKSFVLLRQEMKKSVENTVMTVRHISNLKQVVKYLSNQYNDIKGSTQQSVLIMHKIRSENLRLRSIISDSRKESKNVQNVLARTMTSLKDTQIENDALSRKVRHLDTKISAYSMSMNTSKLKMGNLMAAMMIERANTVNDLKALKNHLRNTQDQLNAEKVKYSRLETRKNKNAAEYMKLAFELQRLKMHLKGARADVSASGSNAIHCQKILKALRLVKDDLHAEQVGLKTKIQTLKTITGFFKAELLKTKNHMKAAD